MYVLLSKQKYIFYNIKTNKRFQNDVNFILFIDCFMFVTLKKLLG
jgi:hypothetical protein